VKAPITLTALYTGMVLYMAATLMKIIKFILNLYPMFKINKNGKTHDLFHDIEKAEKGLKTIAMFAEIQGFNAFFPPNNVRILYVKNTYNNRIDKYKIENA